MTDKIKPQKIRLTDDVLGAIKFEQRIIGQAPDGSLITMPTPEHMKDWVIRDSSMEGFLARVTRGGIRFYAQRKIAGRPCPFDCGSWTAPSPNNTSLAKGRKNARDALAMMILGKDPNLEKKKALREITTERNRAKLTVGRMLEMDRLSRLGKRLEDEADSETSLSRESEPGISEDSEAETSLDSKFTARDRLTVQKWLKGSKIWRTPVFDLTAGLLDEMMRDIRKERGAPSSAKVWRYVRVAWRRLPAADQPTFDPFAEWLKTHKLPESKRRQTSIATDDKQGQAWLKAVVSVREAADPYAFARRVMADYVLCCLCWGARRGEASRLLDTDVNFEKEFVIFRDTKNKRAHCFPLTPGVAAILRIRMADNAERRAKGKGSEPLFVFPSRKRGIAVVEPDGVLELGKMASGLKVNMHDLRRSFAGDVAFDAMVGADGKASGGFGLVKLAMNHADINADVTQGYIMVKPKLKMLRPIYLAQERRVLTAAGLENLLPEQDDNLDELLKALKAKAANPAALKRILEALNGS
jgi:integrase